MYLVKENDVYKREREVQFTNKETITLKHPLPFVYQKEANDWYMTVALEKIDKITENRHLLTSELILSYRWAIREGYNHQLDPSLRKQYDYPRNQNTIKGVLDYVARIKKASDAEMASINAGDH